MNSNRYNVRNIAGKYYLYFGDEQVMTSECGIHQSYGSYRLNPAPS